ncbi:uncharacterized protein GGS22DRAFT_173769 [Annulohypoxylon maeteangense]|uniref:uncharacterized protein n=1 Tax=Annulohypoxylon maeteangense TaxID=1927788 RepID=UPI0020089C49|nr:uncharacterized protein GGS22DRAFT_173769 [Annulohypoxylon maeteangense]KAI0880919.1 hypothetical protein GGS22DRAFT_173769 [Annulohypoxylon maeteangense]
MPRPVETLDIALPIDHPLKRPVSNRNKQTAQRIYQLWNTWPWHLFPTNSPHLPTIWTDNLLDKLKTIALCTTLPHAQQLLNANVPDGQPLSLAVLNAVIDECKEGSDTPENPAMRNRKRKQRRAAAAERQRLGEHQTERGSSEGLDDNNEEEDDPSAYEPDNEQQEFQSGRQPRPLISPSRRLRGRSLATRNSMANEPGSPITKRQKRRHHSSMPLHYSYVTPPESTPTSGSNSDRHVPPRFRFGENMLPSPSSNGVTTNIESVMIRLASVFQEQRQSCEKAVEETRSELGAVKSRLESLEEQLATVRSEITEIEQQKSEMENTYQDLLAIEKEEEGLAARRRELLSRRTSGSRAPSVFLQDEPSPMLPPPSRTRASDELRTDINALIVDQLQPLQLRQTALKTDITGAKTDLEAARAKIEASLMDLSAKSDEMIRFRGFTNDMQDALIRRGFAEPTWELGQKNVDGRERPSTAYGPFSASQPVPASAGFDSPPDRNHDHGLRSLLVGLDSTDSNNLETSPLRPQSA